MNQFSEWDFFTKTKEELIEEIMNGLKEASYDYVAHTDRIPEEHKGRALRYTTSPEALRQWAERELRKKYRFPEDVPEDQLVSAEDRIYLERRIGIIDSFAHYIGSGRKERQENKPYKFDRRPTRIVLPDTSKAMMITLNSWRLFRPWYLAYTLVEDVSSKRLTGDAVSLYRGIGGHFVSYSVANWGDGSFDQYKCHPTTEWRYMIKDDYAVVDKLVQRTNDIISRARSGEIEPRLSY